MSTTSPTKCKAPKSNKRSVDDYESDNYNNHDEINSTQSTNTIKSADASISKTLNPNTNEAAVLRVISRMFRQHADLFLKQASYLEQMSFHLQESDEPNNRNNSSCNKKVTLESIHKDMPDFETSSSGLPPCRENLKDKIRRETVIDLAKKSYEGMKETKIIMENLLRKQQTGIIHQRRKYAFELFQQDVMSKIVEEVDFKNLMKKKAEKIHFDVDSHGDSNDDRDVNENNQELNRYIFKRTQEEWKKLGKQKLIYYARLAEGPLGIEHIPKEKHKRATFHEMQQIQSTQKNKTSEDVKSKEKSSIGQTRKKRRSNQVKTIKEEKSVDTESKEASSADEYSKTSACSKNESVSQHNDQEDSISEEASNDSDSGFDLSMLPPVPIPDISSTAPIKRERDESSSSDEE